MPEYLIYSAKIKVPKEGDDMYGSAESTLAAALEGCEQSGVWVDIDYSTEEVIEEDY